MKKGKDEDSLSVDSSLSEAEPIKPKHISEVTFTSWSEQLSNCQKMIFDGDGEKESRLFWLKTTKDFTKISDMQRYYQFLRYAELRPKLHHLMRAHYFEVWRKSVYINKWKRLSRLVLMKKCLEDFGESGERIKYVRSKISERSYKEVINDEKSKQSLDAIASNMLSTVNPLSILMPKPDIPVHENNNLDSSLTLSFLNSPKSPKSPKRKRSPRSPKSPKSPKTSETPEFPESPVETRDINLIEEANDEKEQITITKCEEEVQTMPIQKKNNLPLYTLIFILALIAGIVAFFFISPAGAFKSSFND